MLVLQECIVKLEKFKETFSQKFGITKLGIFGSVARNENTEDSDIDIVVEVQKPTLRIMYELNEALTELFNCKVDLVRFRDSLRPLFKSNIEQNCCFLQKCSTFESISSSGKQCTYPCCHRTVIRGGTHMLLLATLRRVDNRILCALSTPRFE